LLAEDGVDAESTPDEINEKGHSSAQNDRLLRELLAVDAQRQNVEAIRHRDDTLVATIQTTRRKTFDRRELR